MIGQDEFLEHIDKCIGKKYKCFWCNRKIVDLGKHVKRMHPGLSARSYDNIEVHEPKFKLTVNGITIYTEPYSDLLETSTSYTRKARSG